MRGGNRKAKRNGEILRLYERGVRPGLIARDMGLTRQRIHAIIRAERKRVERKAMKEPTE